MKEISLAYSIARSSAEGNSEPVTPTGNDNFSCFFCFELMTRGESSPVPQLSDTDSKKKRRRARISTSPLSLNDNLHNASSFGLSMIRSYTTVDKVDDDKEKSGDSQAKRSKVGSDNSMFFDCFSVLTVRRLQDLEAS